MKSENNCKQHKTVYEKIEPGNAEKVEIAVDMIIGFNFESYEIATDHAQLTGDYWKLPESVI